MTDLHVVPGAVQRVPLPGADRPLIRALIEVSVAELAAATWWQRRVAAHRMP